MAGSSWFFHGSGLGLIETYTTWYARLPVSDQFKQVLNLLTTVSAVTVSDAARSLSPQ